MPSLTEEEENFVRVIMVLLNVCQKAVHVQFKKEFAPERLQETLRKNQTLLYKLKGSGKITVSQWGILFPKTGTVSSETFDVSLMCLLLNNIAMVKLYDNLPVETDTTIEADLSRLKIYRNRCSHASTTTLSRDEFTSIWKDISEAVRRLGGNHLKQECETWRVATMDSTMQNVILALKHSEEDVMDLKAQIEELNKRFEEFSRQNLRLRGTRYYIQERRIENEVIPEVYIETKTVKNGLKILENGGLVILKSGKDGVGKTTNAIEIIRQYCCCHKDYDLEKLPQNIRECNINYENRDLELRTFNNIMNYIRQRMQFSEKLVLLVDDLFSSNASLCISIDNQLIQCISTLVSIGKIKAIFVMESTSKAENKESILNETNVIDLDSELYQMNVDEKQQLVRKYLEASGIGVVDDDDMACLEKKISHTLLADIVKYNNDDCCIGFPSLVFLFTHINSLRSNGMTFFQFPFDCVRRSIDNLRTSSNETNNVIYSILVSLMLSNARLQKADILKDVRSRFQSRDFDAWDISNILERHDVHYLRSIKANEFRSGLKLYFEFQSKLVHNSVAAIYLNSVLQNHQTDMNLMHNLEIDFIIMFCKPNWYEGKMDEFIVRVDKTFYLPVAEKFINALDAMSSNRYNLYKYLDLISHCSLIEDTEFLQTLLRKGDRIIGNSTDHDVDWYPRDIRFYLPALMLMYTCNKENAMTVVNDLIKYIDQKKVK